MESNLINEQIATMKQQTFQPIKTLVKPISYVRNSIMDAISKTSGYKQKNQRMNQYQNYQLADNLPDSVIEGRALLYITTTIKHHNKISFMKTFIRKSGVFAMALLIANLFFYQQSFTQTVSQPFTANGTFTVPAGVTTVTVEAWGAGGGGGGTTGGFVSANSAGGGGGGAYAKTTNLTVVPLTTYTVTVGTPGSGGLLIF